LKEDDIFKLPLLDETQTNPKFHIEIDLLFFLVLKYRIKYN